MKMSASAERFQSRSSFLIKCLLIVSCVNSIYASKILNPFSVGIRSAINSKGLTEHLKKISNEKRGGKYRMSSYDIDASRDVFNGRSMRNSPPTTVQVSNTDESEKQAKKSFLPRGGATAQSLTFYENMICGAVSRSIAQVATHPANTMKTLLQSNRGTGNPITIKTLARPENMKMLTRGAGAQFIMSIPHGAVNFAVLGYVRKNMLQLSMKSSWASEMSEKSPAFGPVLDFLSSAVATICCSVISTPQMMVVDNIMAGTYSNFPNALIGLTKDKGVMGFYSGWWPGLVGKIPSYVSLKKRYLFFHILLFSIKICLTFLFIRH